jgi:hypothetical protein
MTARMSSSRPPGSHAQGGTRVPARRRRWWIPLAVAGLLSASVLVLLLVVYPRVGARMVREKLTTKLGAKLGREIRIGEVDVRLGHATIRDLQIRGPHDGELPLVHVERVDIEFDAMSSLVGTVELGEATIEGVTVTIRRYADGRDNVFDIVERLTEDRPSGPRGGSGTMPTSIRVTRGRLMADDAQTGATMLIGDGDAAWKPGELIAQARELTATTIGAPKASAARLDIRKVSGEPPTLAIAGGELSLWPKFVLTGIGGTVIADPKREGQYAIDLAGGYGHVPGKLWTAKGPLDPVRRTASIELEAAKFQLDRLAPLLAKTAVVDYAQTSVDTAIHIEVDPDGARFAGRFQLRGLNVGHPMIAEREVHGLDLGGKIAGTFDRKNKKLQLEQGDFVVRDVPFSVTGTIARPTGNLASLETPVKLGPGGVQFLQLELVVPPIDCQRVLAAIPTEMAPHLAGYRTRGVFDAKIALAVDWANLDDLELGGRIAYQQCKVVDQPADSPKRLKEEFEHYVEVEQGKWHSFTVGPSNDDFVPIEDISPYLIKSIMSTEDSAFYRHRGFIPSEFRTALISNLKNEKFKHGASSITMQMVKNVLLYREKTLARKLQELFLTWHVENTLTKDRILEIYFNAIEYGPWLYGIGPAARHYFGKHPRELSPVEAAFFSTILPSPKERYKQYCNGTLTKWTKEKLDRVLGVMRKRDRLTEEEYAAALVTPLLFVKDGTETEKECLERTKQTIKNAVSTNPLAKKQPPAPEPRPKKDKKK